MIKVIPCLSDDITSHDLGDGERRKKRCSRSLRLLGNCRLRLRFVHERHDAQLDSLSSNSSCSSCDLQLDKINSVTIYLKMTRCERIELASGWSWVERDPTLPLSAESQMVWAPATAWPSEIHVELLRAGRIPDPFIGDNEHRVQCTSSARLHTTSRAKRIRAGVGEREWLYRRAFEAPPATRHALQLDGLDTFCDVYLVRAPRLLLRTLDLPATIERPANRKYGQHVPIVHCQLLISLRPTVFSQPWPIDRSLSTTSTMTGRIRSYCTSSPLR
jgi:hypothetical protein